MSNKVLKLVWDAELDLRDKQLLVLLALADWANDTGACWPGLDRIAARTHQSRRNARYVLKQLQAAGIISIRDGGGRHVTNVYSISLSRLQGNRTRLPEHVGTEPPTAQETVQDTVQPPPETVQPADETVQTGDENPAKAVAREPIIEPSKNPSTEAAAAARAELFRLYENNIGLLTPMMVDELKWAQEEYPAAWFPDAFAEAVKANVRRWNYVKAILERWRTSGRDERQGQKREGGPTPAAADDDGRAWYERERARLAREAKEFLQRQSAGRVHLPGELRGPGPH